MKIKSKKIQATNKIQLKKTIKKRREKNKVQLMKRKKSKMMKKRENIEHKKLASREKKTQLKFKVQTGDAQAREEVERKIDELKETSATNKKARKELNRYKKILLTNTKAFK